MALIINKIVSASSRTTFSYLDSEEMLGLQVEATYTFNIADVEYNENDTALTGETALREAFSRDRIGARIGTDTFLHAVPVSLDIPEHNAGTNFTATLTLRDFFSRKVDNNLLSNLVDQIPLIHLLSSLQESFQFQRSNNSYSYQRSISIDYGLSDGTDSFIENAKLFLQNVFLNSRPNYGYQTDEISSVGTFDKGFKGLITERIDLANKSITLEESFDSGEINDSIGSYSIKRKKSVVQENGYSTITYTADIRGTREPVEVFTGLGIALFIDEARTEYSNYGEPLSIEKSIDADGGTATVSLVFSNDPKNTSTTINEYTVTRTKSGRFFEYSYERVYRGEGESPEAALANAKALRASLISAGPTIINGLFGVDVNSLYEKSRDYSQSPYRKEINETVIYSTDPAYTEVGNDILKIELDYSDTAKIPRRRNFVSLTNQTEFFQDRWGDQRKTLGSYSLTARATAKKDANLNEVETTIFNEIISKYKPSISRGSANYYINSIVTNFNIDEGSVDISINYSYF